MLLSNAPKFSPIMLLSAPLCSIYNFIKVLLPESEHKLISYYMQVIKLKTTCNLLNHLTVLVEYTVLFQSSFELLFAGSMFTKHASKTVRIIIPCIVPEIIQHRNHNLYKLALCLSSDNYF